jgi:hypothetical protein
VVKNDGRRQFLEKWSLSQGSFDRHYLRRGQPLPAGDGAVPVPQATLGLALAKIKDSLKRRFRL